MSDGLAKQLESGLIHDTLQVAGAEQEGDSPIQEAVRQRWIADGHDPEEFDRNWDRFAEEGRDPDEIDSCGARTVDTETAELSGVSNG